MIAMPVTTTIMGVTMQGLSDAVRANDAVLQITGMNDTLRTGMDLMTRDLLQAGSGLPKGHIISIPSVGLTIRRPGPPTTTYTLAASDLTIPAVIPGPGDGPEVNGVATDMITILTADNNFTDVVNMLTFRQILRPNQSLTRGGAPEHQGAPGAPGRWYGISAMTRGARHGKMCMPAGRRIA